MPVAIAFEQSHPVITPVECNADCHCFSHVRHVFPGVGLAEGQFPDMPVVLAGNQRFRGLARRMLWGWLAVGLATGTH